MLNQSCRFYLRVYEYCHFVGYSRSLESNSRLFSQDIPHSFPSQCTQQPNGFCPHYKFYLLKTTQNKTNKHMKQKQEEIDNRRLFTLKHELLKISVHRPSAFASHNGGVAAEGPLNMVELRMFRHKCRLIRGEIGNI